MGRDRSLNINNEYNMYPILECAKCYGKNKTGEIELNFYFFIFYFFRIKLLNLGRSHWKDDTWIKTCKNAWVICVDISRKSVPGRATSQSKGLKVGVSLPCSKAGIGKQPVDQT